MTRVTGPFFAFDSLEFSATLEVVAARAVSVAGGDRVRDRRPDVDRDRLADELTAVHELASCVRDEGGFRALASPDLREIVARIRVPASVMEGRELLAVADGIDAMQRTRRAVRAVLDRAPRMAAFLTEVPPPTLEERIRRSIDDDGTVRDGASPQLSRIRTKLRHRRQELVKKLESMASRSAGDARPEVTVREGRYVIPVRRSDQRSVDGIVHDESASGATVFIEPTATIGLGNEVRSLEREEAHEVRRILTELSENVRETAELLAAGWEMLVAVDDIYARARYAADVDGHPPTLVHAPGELRVKRARHPLLLAGAADPDEIVPFDLDLDPAERTVLVSGPNAGGKTVFMKACGLLAMMAQSGVIPPVGRGTTLPIFHAVFADIGDRQSITANLSTFSAHLATLKSILAEADERSLVLIDEIGSGTDPAEGAALAEGVLAALGDRQSLTLVTTHFSSLKRLAQERPEVVNASLQFDTKTLTPTFQLLKGIPGRSYGLAIAERLGIEAPVVEAARRVLDSDHVRLDRLLAELETRHAALEVRDAEIGRREDAVSEREAQLMAREAEVRTGRDKVARRERDVEREGRVAARRYLLEARKTVERTLAEARQVVDEAAARDVRRRLEHAAEAEQGALETLEQSRTEPRHAFVGSVVRVPGGSTGVVRETRGEDRVVVDVRGVRIEVNVAAVEVLETTMDVEETLPPRSVVYESIDATTQLDLRGMRVDEAEATVMRALDEATLADLHEIRIIHGKGTGALRACVHDLLRDDARVRRFRSALPEQGGAGVTCVELA